MGRFLSVDPLTKDYPMLTPYQYASNNPIYNIDIDGLEGLEYLIVVDKLDRAKKKMTKEEVDRLNRIEFYAVMGMSSAPLLLMAPEAIPFLTRAAVAVGPTATATGLTVTNWLQNPRNQQLIAEGGAFVAGVIDPNPTAQYSVGPGDEFGNFVGGIFRTAGKQALNYVFRSPAGDDIVTGAAKLTDDILELDFDVPENLRRSGIGSQMFQDALNYFGDNVKGIRGLWVEGDNLNQLNKALKSGMNMAEAVFSTPTGKWAKQNGYDTFEQVGSSVGDEGIEGIELIFKKSSE